MNVISYGEEKPVAPNKTRADRAQNRRVVIKILA
jgi:outer membrane protein OmpA-like peptidoglycan-associated protein